MQTSGPPDAAFAGNGFDADAFACPKIGCSAERVNRSFLPITFPFTRSVVWRDRDIGGEALKIAGADPDFHRCGSSGRMAR